MKIMKIFFLILFIFFSTDLHLEAKQSGKNKNKGNSENSKDVQNNKSDSDSIKIKIDSVSEKPIFGFESPNAKFNVIGFVGGGGLKGGVGKSGNPLARDRKKIRDAGFNYYIFPNPKAKESISLFYRKDQDHVQKISNLIDYLNKKNNLPAILLGHSRGSVSVAAAANKLGVQKIKGIVIMGSLTASSKAITYTFTMKAMLEKKIDVPVLVVHHEKDRCDVTPYIGAKDLAEKMNFKLIAITGGGNTGDACGPLHHHGFEETMPEVIQVIKKWSEGL